MVLQEASKPAIVGAFLVVSGLLLGGYMTVLEVGLFLIPLRKIAVAVGGVLIAVGVLFTSTGSVRPLTPARAGVVSGAVVVSLGILLWYDLQRVDSLGVALKPLQGFLIAASFGIPLGSALKQEDTRQALLSTGIGVVVLLGTLLYSGGILTPLGPVAVFIIVGSLATGIGYLLTNRRGA